MNPRNPRLPPAPGPRTSHAYLVGFYNKSTMRYYDAGIYSEPSPTMRIGQGDASRVLAEAVVPGWPRYEQACAKLLKHIERTPGLQWTREAPTFLSMARTRAELERQRRKPW